MPQDFHFVELGPPQSPERTQDFAHKRYWARQRRAFRSLGNGHAVDTDSDVEDVVDCCSPLLRRTLAERSRLCSPHVMQTSASSPPADGQATEQRLVCIY
ncbi:unnamed protein product [Effrenium voratum]|nr:unnamed protein product [Effrenium voratum]